MEKLADFMLVEPIFRQTGISPNWLYGLSRGETKVYNDNTILNYYIENDVCIINSGSIDNARFCRAIIKDIISLVKNNKKVIMSSEVESMSRHCFDKYSLVFDKKKSIYTKGV